MSENLDDGKIPEALVEGFLALDEKMRENEELKEEMSGSKHLNKKEITI